MVGGAVCAELLGGRPDLDEVLRAYGVGVDPQMPPAAWRRAGEAHAAYAERRQSSGGGLPRRTLLSGDEGMADGARRWNEESFFKEAKHPFGLAQFALRSALGLDRWILLVFVAWTPAPFFTADQR